VAWVDLDQAERVFSEVFRDTGSIRDGVAAAIWFAQDKRSVARVAHWDLINATASTTGIYPQALTRQSSARSGRRVAVARAVLCACLRRRGLSYPQIASVAGYGDHTSAMAATERGERDDTAWIVDRVWSVVHEKKAAT